MNADQTRRKRLKDVRLWLASFAVTLFQIRVIRVNPRLISNKARSKAGLYMWPLMFGVSRLPELSEVCY
ncbi:hypothetical protein BH20ACI3_BH20ACI3_35940 [soil metagenome]